MKKLLALSGIALSLTLAACGGGGGSDDGGSSQTSAPTPAPTPTPTPLPSLNSPQTNSTAAIGNGIEGYWTTSLSLLTPTSSSKSLAIVAPDGTFQAFSPFGHHVGTLTTSGAAWSASGDMISSGGIDSAFSDAGTFVAKTSLTDSSNSELSFDTYGMTNALAVTQADVTGTWGGTGNIATVNSSGNFSGTTALQGTCGVSGSILQFDSSTSKNIFKVSFTFSQGATNNCRMVIGQTYTGLAVIDMVNAGSTSSPQYLRTLQVIASIPHTSYLWLQLPKN